MASTLERLTLFLFVVMICIMDQNYISLNMCVVKF